MNTVHPRTPTDLPLSQRDCEADGAAHFMPALRDLNEAAHAAAKSARKTNSPLTKILCNIATISDKMVDGELV